MKSVPRFTRDFHRGAMGFACKTVVQGRVQETC